MKIRFKKVLEKADSEVKCLGISLSTINRVVEFRAIVEEKAKLGVSFKFAFMTRNGNDGKDSMYKQRAKDENYPIVDNFSDLSPIATSNINALLSYKDRLDDESRARIEVREYDAIPYMALFIIDDRLFVGTFLFGEKCNNSPVYEIKNTKSDGGIYQTYSNHFDRIWESSLPITEVIKIECALIPIDADHCAKWGQADFTMLS